MEGKNLVIVESPGKVKTIQKFLGGDYLVKASIGHIRDLQEKKLSVDVDHGFQPEYVVPTDKKKVVSELIHKVRQCAWKRRLRDSSLQEADSTGRTCDNHRQEDNQVLHDNP